MRTRLFRQLCALVALCLIIVPFGALAQPAPEASRAQAARSVELLLEAGDRRGAIEAALAALPAEPSAADLAQYPEAMAALARAYANRGFRVDAEGQAMLYLGPDATRAVLAFTMPEAAGPDAALRVQIHDAATGRLIGALLASTGDFPDEGRIAAAVDIAPEAGLVAVHFWNSGRVQVHRLVDGAEVARFDAVPGRMLRVSPDGRYVAIVRDGDTPMQSTVEFRALTDDGSSVTVPTPEITALDWTDQGTVIAAVTNRADPAQPAMEVLEIGADVPIRQLTSDLGLYPWHLTVAPDGRHILLHDGSTLRVLDRAGTLRFALPMPAGVAVFVREGEAVAVLDYAGDRLRDISLDVFGLDGTRRPTEPSDYLVFDTLAYGPDGGILAAPALFSSAGALFDPPPIPQGMALIAQARAAVSVDTETETLATAEAQDETARRVLARAEEAATLLHQGDRRAALIAALQALPAEPSEEDFERFDAAYLMLSRAMAARVLQIPQDAQVFAALDPTGRRMAVGGPEPRLCSMPAGQVIGPLQGPGGRPVSFADNPAFNPSGTRLAVLDQETGSLLIFSSDTGDLLRSIPIPGESTAGGDPILLSGGYSHDGGMFAVETASDLHLVNLATGHVTTRPSLGIPLWLPARQLLLVQPVFGVENGPVARVALADGATVTGAFALFPDPEGLRLSPTNAAVNRSGSVLLLEEGVEPDNRVVLYDGAGSLRAVIDRPDSAVEFIRNGTAIAVLRQGEPLSDSLVVQSLQGETLTARPEDFAPFDQGVFSVDGRSLLRAPFPQGGPRYRGGDRPQGRALWDQAMEEIGPDGRAEVASGRIAFD